MTRVQTLAAPFWFIAAVPHLSKTEFTCRVTWTDAGSLSEHGAVCFDSADIETFLHELMESCFICWSYWNSSDCWDKSHPTTGWTQVVLLISRNQRKKKRKQRQTSCFGKPQWDNKTLQHTEICSCTRQGHRKWKEPAVVQNLGKNLIKLFPQININFRLSSRLGGKQCILGTVHSYQNSTVQQHRTAAQLSLLLPSLRLIKTLKCLFVSGLCWSSALTGERSPAEGSSTWNCPRARHFTHSLLQEECVNQTSSFGPDVQSLLSRELSPNTGQWNVSDSERITAVSAGGAFRGP